MHFCEERLTRGVVCVRMHLRSCMDIEEPGWPNESLWVQKQTNVGGMHKRPEDRMWLHTDRQIENVHDSWHIVHKLTIVNNKGSLKLAFVTKIGGEISTKKRSSDTWKWNYQCIWLEILFSLTSFRGI